jgi:phosphatidylglycerol lysyltransferase
MPAMGFLVELGATSEERHDFVAERAGHLVGIAQVIPVPQRGGWFVQHLLRDPHAPNGTVETLFDAVIRWANDQGSSFLTLGLAPLAGNAPWPLRLARRSVPFLYDFEGLRRFRAKLRPNDWSPIHLTCPRGQGVARSVVDVLSAFAKDGLVWFGMRTIARGPTVLLGLLTLLLVPWVGLIAVAPLRFFAGLAAVKWAWVVFDVTLVLALTMLLRTPSIALATALALAVTLDAALTTLQAGLTVEHWASSASDILVVVTACLAPAFAAFVLWGARARVRRILGAPRPRGAG